MNTELSQPDSETAGTFASEIFQELKRGIIDGKFLPGQKLRIETLRQMFNVGTAPVREALNRLCSEGIVQQQDQRGFRVAMVSMDELRDLTRSRCLVNELLLKESILRGDRNWEERTIVAYYRLVTEPMWLEDSIVPNPKWQHRHREFHIALLSGAAPNILLNFCEDLSYRADRYINLSNNLSRKERKLETEHKDILDAAIARNVEEATRLLTSHFTATMDALISSSMLIEAR